MGQTVVTEQYVDRLKRAYTMLRARWHPGYRGPGGTQQARWEDAAEFLQRNKADPFQFMQFVFDRFIPKAGDVYINWATSTSIVREFLKELPRIKEDAQRRVVLQANLIKDRIANGETLDTILLDPHAELSSIFRFAAAWSVGRKDLAERFRERAQRILTFEPHYATLLSQWLPPSMGGSAKEL